ncbi:hypothetical protein B0T14DRAFT_505469 [Immersiella caudata]|uniref:Uncharacterized protein n=1 Tax=Immersiella caudata TaxID=314043 RepID=A0AA39XFW8_9PEZI|nr:hypothetical protein B0T14DRAFT_505469 [Immersiella caudata]
MLTTLQTAETPQHGSISWHKVAAHLPGRNNKDCRKRWHYSIAHTIRKGTWTKEEDEKLLQAVEKHGARWSKVAGVVGSRNGDQCWKRWYDCLDPRIDKSPWTAEEDARLLHEVARSGRNWSEIVNKHFPNRTSLSAKNRFSILQRRRENAADAAVTSTSSTVLPSPGPVPLLMVEEPEESQLPSTIAPTMGADAGMAGISRLTEGNVTEFLQQSLALSDGWYTEGTLSEVSTPRLPSEMDWTAAWSPSPSTLDVSACSQGLMASYGAGMWFPGTSSTAAFPVESYDTGGFYLTTDQSISSVAAPSTQYTDFLYPEYGNVNW